MIFGDMLLASLAACLALIFYQRARSEFALAAAIAMALQVAASEAVLLLDPMLPWRPVYAAAACGGMLLTRWSASPPSIAGGARVRGGRGRTLLRIMFATVLGLWGLHLIGRFWFCWTFGGGWFGEYEPVLQVLSWAYAGGTAASGLWLLRGGR